MGSLRLALRHARFGVLVMAAVYALSLSAGVLMVQSGNRFALSFRDSLVARAHRADPAARADDEGAHGAAAALDFSRNLGLAAVPETIGGLTLVIPIGLAAYRGWVGGVVSVDGAHRSRLRHVRSAIYYLLADLEVDRCVSCAVVWFDATELRRFLSLVDSPRSDEKAPAAEQPPPQGVNCPRCPAQPLERAHWRQFPLAVWRFARR